MTSAQDLEDLIRRDPDEDENVPEVSSREQEELLAEDSSDEDYLETEVTERDKDFMEESDEAATSNLRSWDQSNERLDRASGSSSSSALPANVVERPRHSPAPRRPGGFASHPVMDPFEARRRPQPLAAPAGEDFVPRRAQRQPMTDYESGRRHLPLMQPPSYSRQLQTVRRRRSPPLLRPPPPRPTLSRQDLEQPAETTQLAVNLDAQPTRELGQYAAFEDDDDVQIVVKEELNGVNAEDYPYNDVTEDEVRFLEERPVVLNNCQVENGMEIGTDIQEPEVIDLSDGDEDDYQVVDDDDDDVKPDIKPQDFVSSGTLTESTGKSLNSRFEDQLNQKLGDIASAMPPVDPSLFKGKVDVNKLRRAFRQLTPEQVSNLITKSGRCEIEFRNIPSNWSSVLLRQMCAAYGSVSSVVCGRKRANVVFDEERSAQQCEKDLFNRMVNEREEKVLVRRRFRTTHY